MYARDISSLNEYIHIFLMSHTADLLMKYTSHFNRWINFHSNVSTKCTMVSLFLSALFLVVVPFCFFAGRREKTTR